MKQKLLLKTMLLLCALVAGSSSVWAIDVTYAISSKNTLTTTGTAPAGSSASMVESYNTSKQMTSGNSQTLTLTGYNGYKITQIKLSMKSNASGGAGKLYYSTDNGSSYSYIIGSSSDGVAFSHAAWYGAWSSSYVDVTKSSLNISCGTSNVIIKIEATANSLYCQSYTLTYEADDARTATTITIDDTGITNTNVFTGTTAGSLAATVKDGETPIGGASVTWSSSDEDVATINASTGAVTLVAEGTTTITANYAGNATYKPSSNTYELIVINENPALVNIWNENFSSYSADDVPNGGTYNYVCTNGSGTTKIYADSNAGGTSPELLIGKSSGTFTATIPLRASTYGYSGDLKLSFKSNVYSVNVKTTTDGITVDGEASEGAGLTFTTKDTHKVTFEGVTTSTENITIVFTATTSNNVRIDDIVLKGVQVASTNPGIAATPTSLTGFTYVVGSGPSAAQTISVSGSNLTEDITLSLGASSKYEMSLNEASDYKNSLVLSPTAGTVAATPVYVRLKEGWAVSDSYAGTITLTSAGADDVEVSLAGSVTATNLTWDLSTNSSTSATENLVTWASTYATMTLAKGSSTTAANNYLASSDPHTRIYKDQVLKFTPVPGYSIIKAEITATSSSYATGFTGNDWTNASKSTSGSIVTITPTNRKEAFYGTISAACRATAVKVYYEDADETVIAISAAEWASYSSAKPLDFEGTGVTAYIAKAKDASNVTLTPIEKVPANTGIVVNGTAANHTIPVLVGDTPDDTTGNLLKPWLTAGTPTDGTYYTLAAGPSFKKSSGGTLAAGKSYLVLSGESPSLGVDIDESTGEEETTGIKSIDNSQLTIDNVYDLQGRKVTQPTKGLYIVNGRKMVVK